MEHGEVSKFEFRIALQGSTAGHTHELLTVHKLLLLLGSDADQVGVELLTVLLRLQPGVSLRKVEVTVAPERHPALGAALNSYTGI